MQAQRTLRGTSKLPTAPLKTSLAQDPTWFLQEVIVMKKDKVLQDVLEMYSTGILKLKWTLGRSWQLKHHRIEPARSEKKKKEIDKTSSLPKVQTITSYNVKQEEGCHQELFFFLFFFILLYTIISPFQADNNMR